MRAKGAQVQSTEDYGRFLSELLILVLSQTLGLSLRRVPLSLTASGVRSCCCPPEARSYTARAVADLDLLGAPRFELRFAALSAGGPAHINPSVGGPSPGSVVEMRSSLFG